MNSSNESSPVRRNEMAWDRVALDHKAVERAFLRNVDSIVELERTGNESWLAASTSVLEGGARDKLFEETSFDYLTPKNYSKPPESMKQVFNEHQFSVFKEELAEMNRVVLGKSRDYVFKQNRRIYNEGRQTLLRKMMQAQDATIVNYNEAHVSYEELLTSHASFQTAQVEWTSKEQAWASQKIEYERVNDALRINGRNMRESIRNIATQRDSLQTANAELESNNLELLNEVQTLLDRFAAMERADTNNPGTQLIPKNEPCEKQSMEELRREVETLRYRCQEYEDTLTKLYEIPEEKTEKKTEEK